MVLQNQINTEKGILSNKTLWPKNPDNTVR